MPCPTTGRELTYNERRYTRVYAFVWNYGRRKGQGATLRELGALLGLAHDGTALKTLVDTMVAAGWLVKGRDRTSRFAPLRVRALWHEGLWERHIGKGRG